MISKIQIQGFPTVIEMEKQHGIRWWIGIRNQLKAQAPEIYQNALEQYHQERIQPELPPPSARLWQNPETPVNRSVPQDPGPAINPMPPIPDQNPPVVDLPPPANPFDTPKLEEEFGLLDNWLDSSEAGFLGFQYSTLWEHLAATS
jgi:hypothetical protein